MYRCITIGCLLPAKKDSHYCESCLAKFAELFKDETGDLAEAIASGEFEREE